MQQKIKRKKSLYRRLEQNEKVQAMSAIVLPIILSVIIVILWQTQILHKLLSTDTFTLPLLDRIGSIIADNVGNIYKNVVATMIVALLGLFFGSLLGYGGAVIAALFPRIGKGGLSVLGAFASIPVVALAPVFNNWTKGISSDANIRSMIAKIIVVMLISAANMCLNAYRGLTELKPYSEDLMDTYAAKKRVVLFKLCIPNSIPYIFVALKVAVPASIMTAIVSEYFAEYIIGVGRQIRENIVLAQYPTAWAYIVIACAIGIISYVILVIIENIIFKKYYH
ncbi:ABC transporter permease subunit [Clostridium sp. BJN0001]|uniref:ABC transporter permease n=1 Tax=Clostridium sp. BJN0001 TaxID=2930219 RepID=UPI001FD24FF6|nr:ABC transporter permease subunit [Clostridium sp. BJN0001]